MANVQKVSVALTSEFVALLEEAVATGEYMSASKVVRDALRDWKLRRSSPPFDAEQLRRLWNEGVASGPGGFQSIDEIKKEARRRAGRRRASV